MKSVQLPDQFINTVKQIQHIQAEQLNIDTFLLLVKDQEKIFRSSNKFSKGTYLPHDIKAYNDLETIRKSIKDIQSQMQILKSAAEE